MSKDRKSSKEEKLPQKKSKLMSEAQKNNSQMTVGNNSNLTTNTRAAGAADFAKKNDITDKKKSDISSSGVFSYHKNLKDDGTKTQDKMVVVMKKDNVA